MPDKKAVGRRIRSWCVDAGITNKEAAAQLGIPFSTFKGWVYGSRSMSFKQAEAIADLFGKSLDELACRELPKAS